MRIAGISIADGKLSLVSRHASGLSLSVLGLDPRGLNLLEQGTAVETGSLSSLFAVPSPARLSTGSSAFQMSAIGYDEFGNSVAVSPTWSIVTGSPFASINPSTGVITTGTAGQEETITVRATVGAITADATVIIEDIVLDSLVISPATSPFQMTVGGAQTFTAVGYSGGNAVSITPVWTKTSGGGSISASGVFTAPTAPGTTVIRATVGAVFAERTIQTNIGEIVSLHVDPAFPYAAVGPVELTLTGQDVYGNVYTFPGQYPGTIQWECYEGGSIGGNQPTATLVPYEVAEYTEYTDAIRVTWQELELFISFGVEPGAGSGGPAT